MRFLLECVRCCCKTLPVDKDEPPSSRTADETRLLIPPGAKIRLRRRRRGQRVPDWRPSLFSIAEETPIRVARPDNLVLPESSRSFKFRRRSSFCVDPCAIDDRDAGRDHQSMRIPISTAAPFMMF